MKAKITKRLVDATTADAGNPVFVFDTDLAGFVLKVTPTGGRTYQLRYRMGGRDAVLRTYTIGKHGPLTPDQARRIAEGLVGDIARGIDPAAAKIKRQTEDRGAVTIAALSREFLAIYGSTKLKPRSLIEHARAFNTHINPRIGNLKVRDTTHGDVERLHHAMRDMPPTANRTVAALSKFFSWAIRGGYRPDRQNPCQGLEKFKEQARERYLSHVEIAAVGDAIRACEADGTISAWHAGLFRCLLLTGMRRDELRTLEWSWIDFERNVFVLPDSKVGRRDIPISAPVLQVLVALPRVEGNKFVFCGSKSGRPIINVSKAWKRVLAKAGIAHARPHDLRHTAASVGAAAGSSLLLIGGVLGHKSPQTTERYSHLSDDPVRQTSETIAQRVAAALDSGTQPSANVVVPLKRPAGGA